MIGFTMKVGGTYGYTRDVSKWSEGDLWLMKAALGAAKNKATKGGNSAVVDAIEGQFTKIKELRLDDVAAVGDGLRLTVRGGFHFSYVFASGKSTSQRRADLVNKIANCSTDMGDQVAMQLFETIYAHRAYCQSKELNAYPHERWLAVDVAL